MKCLSVLDQTNSTTSLATVDLKAGTVLNYQLDTLVKCRNQLESVREVLNTYGYTNALVAAVGGEAFLSTIHMTPAELKGRTSTELRDSFLANIGPTLQAVGKKVWEKIVAFIKWLIETAKSLKITIQNNLLMHLQHIPENLEATHIVNRTELVTVVEAYRKLMIPLTEWGSELAKGPANITKLAGTSGPITPDNQCNISDIITNKLTKDLSSPEWQTYYVPTSSDVTSQSPKFQLSLNEEAPVNVRSQGWTDGSSIRQLYNTISGLHKQLDRLITSMSNLLNAVKKTSDTTDALVMVYNTIVMNFAAKLRTSFYGINYCLDVFRRTIVSIADAIKEQHFREQIAQHF